MLSNKIMNTFMISEGENRGILALTFTRGLAVVFFGGRLNLLWPDGRSLWAEIVLFCSPTCRATHKTQTFNYTRVLPLSSSFFLPKSFSHTLTASFLPCIRLLLFNSGRPDVHLITALLSRTTAENNWRLFSPAAMANRAKYTPTATNTDDHCCDSLLFLSSYFPCSSH